MKNKYFWITKFQNKNGDSGWGILTSRHIFIFNWNNFKKRFFK